MPCGEGTLPPAWCGSKWQIVPLRLVHCKSPSRHNLLPSPIVSVAGPSGSAGKSTRWGVRRGLCHIWLLTFVRCISSSAPILAGQDARQAYRLPSRCILPLPGFWPVAFCTAWVALFPGPGSAPRSTAGGGIERSHISISAEPSAKHFTHITS